MISMHTIRNTTSLLFSGLIVFLSLLFAYVMLVPVNVLEDWTITVEAKDYHPGDKIIVHNSFTKLMNKGGQAYYYLECSTPTGSTVRYPINQTESNRAKGKWKVDQEVKVPSAITASSPKCHIAVSIDYDIYTIRKFTENNVSNEFAVRKGE